MNNCFSNGTYSKMTSTICQNWFWKTHFCVNKLKFYSNLTSMWFTYISNNLYRDLNSNISILQGWHRRVLMANLLQKLILWSGLLYHHHWCWCWHYLSIYYLIALGTCAGEIWTKSKSLKFSDSLFFIFCPAYIMQIDFTGYSGISIRLPSWFLVVYFSVQI